MVDNAGGTANMCTEFWDIGQEAGACVILTGYMKRLWATGSPDNTSAGSEDVTCDFGLDYVSHTIKIQIGSYAAGVAAADTMRFSQDVNFQDFYESEGSVSDFTCSLAFLLAGLLAISF